MARNYVELPYTLASDTCGTIKIDIRKDTTMSPSNYLTMRQEITDEDGKIEDRVIFIALDGTTEQIQFFSRLLELSIEVYNFKNEKTRRRLVDIPSLNKPLEKPNVD
jgi:hypothetical protein